MLKKDKIVLSQKNQVTTKKDKIKILAIGIVIFIVITVIGYVVGNIGAGLEETLFANA